jgi:hypothetical protein
MLHALEQSERRRGPLIAGWTGRYPFKPHLDVSGWSFAEAAESIHEGILAAAWEELVAAWLGPDGRPKRAMS